MIEKDNLIVRLTFQFSLDVIGFTERLEQMKKFNLSNQLFRSGTSIGANVREAQGCESRADFVHKMKIAYKEVEETRYLLELCAQSENYPAPLSASISAAGTTARSTASVPPLEKR